MPAGAAVFFVDAHQRDSSGLIRNITGADVFEYSLTPPTVAVYPMDAVNDVHRLVEAGEAPAGKIVFEVSST